MAVQVSGDPDPANNGLFHIYTDHLGSTGAMSNSSGVYIPDSHAKYTPFGDWRTEPTATAGDRYYTGHKHNNLGGGADDLGLVYMNARYYVPGIARFASADTIVPNPANPQSLNRFSYTRNNPLGFIDPSGHRECNAPSVPASEQCDSEEFFFEDPATNLVGTTHAGANTPSLADAMKTLFGLPDEDSPEFEAALQALADARGLTKAEATANWQRYKMLRSNAIANGWSPELPSDEWWGSEWQLRFGKVVGDTLDMDAAFAALLSPAGGMIGPGNTALHDSMLADGFMADFLDGPFGDYNHEAMLYHGAVHDAAGYLYNFQNKGPGYAYLSTYETGNFLMGQGAYRSYWREILGPGGEYNWDYSWLLID